MFARTEALVYCPDDQLVARCRAGDVDAFNQLYVLHGGLIFRHAYHILGHEEDARDVRQETFLRAYQAMASFRGECSFKTWLLQICTNQCRSRLRSRTRRKETGLDAISNLEPLDLPHVEDPAAQVERTQISATVLGALQRLPAIYRELIVLRDIEDLTYIEIAGILGCSSTSVSVRLFRARSAFRKIVHSLLEEA